MPLLILWLCLYISGSLAALRDPLARELAENINAVRDSICHSSENTECFTYRPDLHLCMHPICGGYWIHLYTEESREGQEQTECADGTFAEECYVANFDKSCISDSFFESDAVICGSYVREAYEHFPGVSNLLIKKPECLLENDQQSEVVCYQTRPDPRLCPPPVCGGQWLSSSSGDGSVIACPDGNLAEECYVAVMDDTCLASLNADSTTSYSESTSYGLEWIEHDLVCGRFINGDYEGFPGFYDFQVMGVFRAI